MGVVTAQTLLQHTLATCTESVPRLPHEEEMDKFIVHPESQSWEKSFNTSQEQNVETSTITLNQLGINCRCGHYYGNTYGSVFVDSYPDFDEVDYKFSVLSRTHTQAHSVYIQHLNSGSNQCIRMPNKDGDRKLVVDGLQRDSELFMFKRSKYIGKYINRIYAIIHLSGELHGQRQYVSADDKNTVCLQKKESLSADVKELDSTDSRFFILRPAGAGHNCFESTKCPDCFLAYDGSKIFLKHIPKATDLMLGNDHEVVFRIWPCDASTSS